MVLEVETLRVDIVLFYWFGQEAVAFGDAIDIGGTCLEW